MDKSKNDKWYDNPSIVDTLLFILPPAGMYGLYKTRNIKSSINRILYGVLGFLSVLLMIISLT